MVFFIFYIQIRPPFFCPFCVIRRLHFSRRLLSIEAGFSGSLHFFILFLYFILGILSFPMPYVFSWEVWKRDALQHTQKTKEPQDTVFFCALRFLSVLTSFQLTLFSFSSFGKEGRPRTCLRQRYRRGTACGCCPLCLRSKAVYAIFRRSHTIRHVRTRSRTWL